MTSQHSLARSSFITRENRSPTDRATFPAILACVRRCQTGLYSLRSPSLADPERIGKLGLGPAGDDPSRKGYGTPRRGQSVPGPAEGGAMLTLLRTRAL
jgi:hypothetical protein